MSSKNLDQLFKKALLDKGCEPPPYIWENIEQQLDRKKRNTGFWWLRSVAAAAAITLLLSIWLLQSDKLAEVHTAGSPDVATATLIPEQPIKIEIAKTATEKQISEISIQKTEPVSGQPEAEKKQLLLAQATSLKGTSVISNTAPEANIKQSTLRKDFIPLTSKDAIENNKIYQALLDKTGEIQKPEKKKMKFELSGHFVPAYSSGTYSSSVKDARGVNYSDNQMEGLMNAGGGLRLSVSAGKRLSIQTGVYYSRMGQKTTENAGVPGNATFTLRNTANMKTTPLGNIKTRTQAVAYRSAEAIVLNAINGTDQTLEQVFGTLEVPLHLRYLLNDNKIRFSLSGGFSGNFIVNNKVYLKSSEGKELLGSTENIRNFNMSTDLGLGVEYPITRKIRIMVEPGFKYYLNSLSEDKSIDFKPYLFTFSTGIGIEF